MSPTPDEIRIREALERIQTPAYDIAGAVREQRARRGRRMPLRSPRRLVSAVLAAALLTVTARPPYFRFRSAGKPSSGRML